MSEDKKLGLGSVVSISVGLVIATSCLVSLGQGAGTVGVVFIFSMIIACLLNMTTVASLSELNAIMPNTTGGLAQYTLACLGPFPTLISMVGGYLLCNMVWRLRFFPMRWRRRSSYRFPALRIRW